MIRSGTCLGSPAVGTGSGVINPPWDGATSRLEEAFGNLLGRQALRSPTQSAFGGFC